MASKVKYKQFKRNTLLEELRSILDEYPDNEQIIKELLQNAEDAGARVVKIGFCPSSNVVHLEEPYKKYLSGPALCFYNDSVFEEEDWDGITMVRKSNKQDNPLKVGKFGIGFKSVFHVTDFVCIISGEKILFIDPLSELCPFNTLEEFTSEDICGPRGLEPLYGLFDISREMVENGKYQGSFFWFPLRKSASDLSKNIYTPGKAENLFSCFKQEIAIEIMFLTSVEEIHVFKGAENTSEIDYSVSVDASCLEKVRLERSQYKEKLRKLEVELLRDDNMIHKNNPVLMKTILEFRVQMESCESSQKWLVVQYFHTGIMNEKYSVIRNQHCKHRPYGGIAARLDAPIPSGQIFCSLPLPSTHESSTGLPVHVHGCFALDSNRQHLKWPSHDQIISNSHLEKDMTWNVLMVEDVLPKVYIEFLNSWTDDLQCDMANHLEMFYHYIPRPSKVKYHWKRISELVQIHILNSEIPCLRTRNWMKLQDAYFVMFKDDISMNMKVTVSNLFEMCTNKTIMLEKNADLYDEWLKMGLASQCTSPCETRRVLKKCKVYEQMSPKEKTDLLVYCCSDGEVGLSDLDRIELLPISNGCFEKFSEEKPQKMYYLCEENEHELLIGMEACLVQYQCTEVGHVLKSLALSEMYNFHRLDETAFFKLLHNVTVRKGTEVLLVENSGNVFGDKWLQSVWKYLETHCQNSLHSVADLHLVKTEGCNVLRKLSECFISSVGIDSALKKILEYFNIWVVDPDFHRHPLMQPGKGIVFQTSDYEKEKILLQCIEKGIVSFNSGFPEEKELFKEFLPNVTSSCLANAYRNLKIFRCFLRVEKMVGYVSVKECNLVYVGDKDFPISFPQNMIIASSKKETRLLKDLGLISITLTDVVKMCIEKMKQNSHFLNGTERRCLCFYILSKRSSLTNWFSIQASLVDIKFIQNEKGKICSANELYDPEDKLMRDLFCGELRFPVEKKEYMTLLTHLQFLGRNSETLKKDVVVTCQLLHTNSLNIKQSSEKSKALIQIFTMCPDLFNAVYDSTTDYKIMQYQTKRPESYPRSLEWYSSKINLVSIKETYSEECRHIIGSISPTMLKDWEILIMSKFRLTVPSPQEVIQHFRKITECYCEEEHVDYCYLVQKLYQYVSKQPEIAFPKNVFPDKCILTEQGFRRPENIYIDRSNHDLNLTPYFVPLQKEYRIMKPFFERLGCKTKQTSSLLVAVLYEIKNTHSSEASMTDYDYDLNIVQQVLKTLADRFTCELSDIKREIVVPIHKDGDRLIFRRSEECAFSDTDWFSRTFTDDDNIILVHPKIDKEVAKAVGVRSLKEFTLSDAEDIFSEFGQSEPLTCRINCLLKEGYTDGLSVPKELIQNADDAGASEVCFFYDERENLDARSCLLDPGMHSCQGPALWVFNNAEFTPEDFVNIQKLSGVTKKDNPTKIGKFGLGFNAVYNLTDVPSFVSGKHLVYLDPHGKYLGDALLNKNSPGIKLNLHNKFMLQKLENQFKPFQNVFHFTSTEFLTGKRFNGTLFRFPLRTKEQAATSEILGKAYSKSEMENLLKMFCKTCGNLLLFTQNVQCIKLFHLDRECSNPDKEMKLVLSAQKSEEWNSKDYEQNILSCAAKFCNRLENWTTVCDSKIVMEGICHSWLEVREPIKQTVHWMIAWSTGISNAQKLGKGRDNGALPISCVAVPVESVDKSITPLLFNDSSGHFEKFGFYDIGHLFCFLPLPIQTKFNFHVNGMFAVSSDRQRLLMHTEDDKHTSDECLWNTSVISDATLESLIQLLLEFKNVSSEKYMFTVLWPVECDEDIWKEFHEEFYKALAERPLPLFKTFCGWKSFQECLFLHPEISENEKLKSIAFRILRDYPLRGKAITDLPCNVFNAFQNCIGADFEEHIVTYEKFIIESFLPYFSNSEGLEYDVLVVDAIKSNNEKILAEIQCSKCIRTCDTSIRKAPRDLVHPESPLKEIFVPNIECFPNETFFSGEVLDILVKRGMLKERIPWDLLIRQTKTITRIASCCSSFAVIRSHEIMKYIHNVFNEIPEEVKRELSQVPFLPVKNKPKSWPLEWYTEDMKQANILKKCIAHEKSGCSESTKIVCFEKPSNLYFQSTENLVACTESILDYYSEEDLYSFDLTSLGVKCKKNVTQQILKLQLQAVVANPENAQDIAVEKICFDIYGAMEEYLMESDWQEFVKEELSDTPCILINRCFISAKQVVFQLEHDCSPYLYGLQSTSLNRYSKFMETIGVRREFAADDIADTLLHLKNHFNEHQLSETELSLVCRIANLLGKYKELPARDMYLPDSKGYFQPLSSLCLDDCDWIPTSDSMKFLNEKVTPCVAKLLDVKSKRTQNIMDDSEELGDEFGQYEKLTSRIKCILDGYPECSILKELLQNADDAGATELHFIIDCRSHRTEHVFSEEWKHLQGPALCVFNNSVFSEADIKGIQDLGIGSKKNDAISMGQYGVGFNAVYNITDAPSFYSHDVNQSTETLCILDPQCKYIPWASEKKPGRIFRDASKVQEKYKDIIPCYLQDTELWKGSHGTVFRFPLRTEESRLSSKQFSCDEIEKLLMKFREEVPECLLFLQNTKTVVFSKITVDGDFEKDYYVRSKQYSTPECSELFSSIVEAVKQMKQNPIHACTVQRKDVQSKLKLDINGKDNQEWIIVKGFGFLHPLNVGLKVRDAYREKQLALLPISGVAIFLNGSKVDEEKQLKDINLSTFKTFCGLPLPGESGLPVHINGQFALDNETRKHIEFTEFHELKLEWNKCLIENVIAPTYACAIQHLKNELFPIDMKHSNEKILEKFYNIFPVLSSTSREESCYLAKMLYKCLYSQSYPVFPMVRNISNAMKKNDRRLVNTEFNANVVTEDLIEISWTVLQKGNMSLSQPFVCSSWKKDIAEILKDLGMTLVKLPDGILKSIKDAELNVETLSPNGVISFLNTYRRNGNDGCVLSQINVQVSCTPFKSTEGVLALLEYCRKSKKHLDFENCPLIVSADGFIREFSKHKKLYLAQYPTLFPKSAEKFVHQDLCSFFSRSKHFVDFVENLEIQEIRRQVQINIGYHYCVGDTIPWLSKEHDLPDENWISEFWLQIFKLSEDRYDRAYTKLKERMKKLLESKNDIERNEIILCQKSLENLKKDVLESFCAELLNEMGNVSCIPVCIKRETCKRFLFPLSKCNAVLFVQETHREENAILTSMRVPVIHSICSPIKSKSVSNILKILMANCDKSFSILNCIFANKNELQVNFSDCYILLNYFQTCIKQLLDEGTNEYQLLCLPIFQAVSKKVVAVNDRIAVSLPEEIPEEGLRDWGEKERIVFVLDDRHFQSLYKYLGFHAVDKYCVYIQYILPSFKSLPHDAVIQHMKFIRDNLLPPLLNNEDMKYKLDELRSLLHEIAFLRMTDETYVRPCQLYNRHAELFMLENQLCSESELPPEPYHTREWEKFLIFCGMKNDFTAEVFCDFASRLQALGDENGMTNIVQKNSHRLIEILKKTPDLLKNHHFINKMKHIRFLCPQHTDGLCKMLLPEASSNEKLIAYDNSTYSYNLHLVWSEMNVLCENVDPFCNQENSEASKLLGISDPPPLQTVVAHIESLCNSIQSNFGENICQESGVEEKFAKIMENIYRYLEKCGTTWSEKMLHQVPFIFLRENKILVTADRVVLRLRDEDEIIPYICKPSAHFGQFHTLLEKYGSHIRVKSSHCASILKTIRQESGGHILKPSDIARVQKAIRLLFQTIKNEKDVDLNVTNLFLLSTKNRLNDSRAMVFVDNVHLEKRIGENKLKYECFVGFKNLSMNVMDQITEIKYLPERVRPLLLSDLIQEDLTVESRHTVLNSDSSQHLQRFLHSAEFFVGICRLILQECVENETSFSQEEQINVQTKLRAIHVEQVEALKTVLKYEDSVLPKTEEDTSIFTKMGCGDEASLFLYYKMGMGMDMDLWIADNAVPLSKTLNRYLNKLLGNQTICLPSILGCVSNSHSISSVLDRLKIAHIDVKIPTIASFMPELGAEIPVSCHYLVNNLCALIDESEYIAYELFDPIVDEDDPGVCNSTPVYIFAKAVERLSRSSSQTAKASDWQIRYKVNVGGQIIISEASRVYRFVGNERRNEEGCDDVDDTTVVKKDDDQEKIYIRDVMKNGIKKSKAEFRRIFKRLYLHYHPEEHIDNKDYFHQLIQFICFIQLKLENKGSVENADILSFRRNEEHNVIPVLERICSVRLNEYRKNRKECQEKQGKTLLFENFRERGPQPGQSRRWFRQAETDFKAASTDEFEPSSYNWACYKCHQAVEKALKALQYQLDADKVSLNIHSLSILASPIADVKLSGLVGQLEGITGDYFCMRYPGVIHGGCISSDLYTEDQAKRAIERTGEILQIVRERLRSS